MATAELTGPHSGAPGGGQGGAALGARAGAGVRFPLAITAALLVVILYAAFEHGAVTLPAEARLQVAIAALAAAAGGAWLWTGTLRLAAPRIALIGTALLAAFACWSGITLFWSVAPDQTWIELNRAITYVIVLCLAIALGASYAGAIRQAAKGFLLVALAVTAYGFGQKLFPGLHVSGVFDLNQTGPLPRLQEPLGYWNALALFVAMAVPIALALATDAGRTSAARISPLCALVPMLLVIALTYSRGGLLALAIALVVGIASSGERLRALMWLAAAALATVPSLVFALESHSLTATGVSLGHRETAGAELTLILLASLGLLIVAGRRLLTVEPHVQISPARAPGVRRLMLAIGVVVVVGALVGVSLSSRGLGGTVSHAWHTFTSTRATSNTNPSRLLSADSENRWVWWKEAAGGFSDRPVAGWGAGSFGVVHLLYRRDTLTVQQPHSVPLQFLAETGIVGALLAIGGFVLLVAGAGGAPRRLPPGSERLLGGALLAGAVAYGVHSIYDWDWDIPAVSLPAFLFLGVLAGSRAPAPAAAAAPLRGPSARALALGSLTLWLCAFALSAALPSLAASKASSALVRASSSSPSALRSAQAGAAQASDLDPLSDAGLRVEATIAIHRGQLPRAREYLTQAVGREPTDVQAWSQLGEVDALLGDFRGVNRAAQRLIRLDPRGQDVQVLERARLLGAPPTDSVTATETPPAAK
jgi:hypothetical protein